MKINNKTDLNLKVNSILDGNIVKLKKINSKLDEIEKSNKVKSYSITLKNIKELRNKVEDAVFSFKLSKKGYKYRKDKVQEFLGNISIERKKY